MVIETAADMHALGVDLASIVGPGDLIVLAGPLGAGKTTLTRGLGEGLEVRGPVTSPTFVLARTHPSLVGGSPLVHVDAYRLSSALELDDLDIDFDRSVVVVEWGSGMLDGVAESWLEVDIARPTGASAADIGHGAALDGSDVETGSELDRDEPRVVTVRGFGPRWGAAGSA
ncbi:tRNA (adenosine(37)-N6)-threonylcarbamoyltransferase complex ATPase subunit type 1 TsaE [Diaminobutyricibacter sp. McL0608]|uniref:tRNA (adenosine(37)-N6)-threonylcarbamoyltransferase complex ATPase subunit type 1 TsaE n=1 Tax=Leifsonia sp. McL0608 TaxID=3143537 RepID=UPI0031F30CE5